MDTSPMLPVDNGPDGVNVFEAMRQAGHTKPETTMKYTLVQSERCEKAVLGLQRRLRDLTASVRTQRALTHRTIFREALTWLEVHGDAPDVVEHWITVLAERGTDEPVGALPDGERPPRRRRRRRRRFVPAT